MKDAKGRYTEEDIQRERNGKMQKKGCRARDRQRGRNGRIERSGLGRERNGKERRRVRINGRRDEGKDWEGRSQGIGYFFSTDSEGTIAFKPNGTSMRNQRSIWS